MVDTTKTTHTAPRTASAAAAAVNLAVVQACASLTIYSQARYKDEIMENLRQALIRNDLDAFDDLITEYVARGPTSGPKERTIRTLAPIMDAAVGADRAEFAEKLLQRGLPFYDLYIRIALEARALRCMALFLQRGVDINKPQGESTMPIWGHTTASSDRDLLYWLLDRGADLNVAAEWLSATPMSMVVEDATPDLVRDVLEDPRQLVDVYKGDLLHHALGRKTRDTNDLLTILGLLLDHGAPINEGLYARHPRSQSMYFFMPRGPPLHKAAEGGQLEAVQYLLSRHTDVFIRDTQGKTALHYAQKEGHTKIVEVLQKAMAEASVQHL